MVFLPTTFLGLRISILGSLDARWNKASAEIPIPGAIAPPIYSPLDDT
jgi:hypothetical protein